MRLTWQQPVAKSHHITLKEEEAVEISLASYGCKELLWLPVTQGWIASQDDISSLVCHDTELKNYPKQVIIITVLLLQPTCFNRLHIQRFSSAHLGCNKGSFESLLTQRSAAHWISLFQIILCTPHRI